MMKQANKRHHCDRCQKDFARLEHLQRHERSHTKERPFQCSICMKSFTRKDLLARHDRLTHRERVAQVPDHQQAPISPTSIARTSVVESSNDANGPVSGDQLVETLLGSDLAENAMASALASVQPSVEVDFEGLQTSLDFSPDDFTSFMDNVVIPSNPFSPSYQPMPTFSPDYLVREPSSVRPNTCAQPSVGGGLIEMTPDDMVSPFGSRLPSLQPEDPTNRGPTHGALANSQFIVTTECRVRLEQELICREDIVPGGFVLPSRHTLSRLVVSYFRNFHDHYPFLHAPTICMDKLSPGLFLGIVALGGRYLREPEMSTRLFSAAKAMAMEQMRQHRQAGVNDTLAPWRKPQTPSVQSNTANQVLQERSLDTNLELVQTFLLLIAIATWFNREPDAYEAMSMRSIVDSLLRESAMNDTETWQAPGWQSWIRSETMKRTKLVAFCLFNIHTIVFDLPPMMLPSDLDAEPPCSEREWRADSEQAWINKTNSMETAANLQESLELLFEYLPTSGLQKPPRFSSFGGFILIHAIIQRIWLFRHTQFSRPRERRDLVFSDIGMFERALKNWTSCWERDLERSINPLSPDGPLSFTSTALLRLAYIRLNMDLGPARSLSTWNPELIAKSLDQNVTVQRNEKLTRAALHCAHALSIPVQLGLRYVAKTQVVYWSNQHAFCSLECAVLLAKWLEAVTQPHMSPALTPAEEKVLVFVAKLIIETDCTLNLQQVFQRKAMLSAATVRLWATLYDCDSVWEMVNLIGRSLTAYAELLEGRYGT